MSAGCAGRSLPVYIVCFQYGQLSGTGRGSQPHGVRQEVPLALRGVAGREDGVVSPAPATTDLSSLRF